MACLARRWLTSCIPISRSSKPQGTNDDHGTVVLSVIVVSVMHRASLFVRLTTSSVDAGPGNHKVLEELSTDRGTTTSQSVQQEEEEDVLECRPRCTLDRVRLCSSRVDYVWFA